MGRKQSDDKKTSESETEVEEKEDTPVVKELKEIDDRYLAIEREYEKEVNAIMKKYNDLQKPLLAERNVVLANASKAEGGEAGKGTPAIRSFWLDAFKNHPQVNEYVFEHDEPVLEYLQDVSHSNIDDEDPAKGFKLVFKFVENPYFKNTEISKTYRVSEPCPYRDDLDVEEVVSDEIDWKSGMDVTVATITKKVKGGGAKKNKQKKEKDAPRPSFFRNFFATYKIGDTPPEGSGVDYMSDGADDEEVLEMLMENDHDVGVAIKDSVIPFAVRWYTGEASPPMEDDDEDEESEMESNEGDEEESDDDESSSRHSPKKNLKNKNPPPPAEECKQQ